MHGLQLADWALENLNRVNLLFPAAGRSTSLQSSRIHRFV